MKRSIIAMLAVAVAASPALAAKKVPERSAWRVTDPAAFSKIKSIALFTTVVASEPLIHDQEMFTEVVQAVALKAMGMVLSSYRTFSVLHGEQVEYAFGTNALPVEVPVAWFGKFKDERFADCPARVAQAVRRKLGVDAFVVVSAPYWNNGGFDSAPPPSMKSAMKALIRAEWSPGSTSTRVVLAAQVCESGTGRQIAYIRGERLSWQSLYSVDQLAWAEASQYAADLIRLKLSSPASSPRPTAEKPASEEKQAFVTGAEPDGAAAAEEVPSDAAPGIIVPDMIAVLPFENHSNELRAADSMRAWIAGQMRLRGYPVQPASETFPRLKRAGVTDGGQLPSLSRKRLLETLGTPAALYGEVIDFRQVNVGVLVQNKIELDLKLVHLGSGDVLWEGKDAIQNSVVAAPKDALDTFVAGAAARWRDIVADAPMPHESMQISRIMMRGLPRAEYPAVVAEEEPRSPKRRSAPR